MPIKKASKTHTSARKKNAASSASSVRAKKTASKHSQLAAKSKSTKPKSAKSKKTKKNGERPAWLKKRDELTLKMFQMVYDDYQQGKFHRIL